MINLAGLPLKAKAINSFSANMNKLLPMPKQFHVIKTRGGICTHPFFKSDANKSYLGCRPKYVWHTLTVYFTMEYVLHTNAKVATFFGVRSKNSNLIWNGCKKYWYFEVIPRFATFWINFSLSNAKSEIAPMFIQHT